MLGKKRDNARVRMNCFVMDAVQFSVMNINSDIPVAAVTMMNWNLVGVYREWKVPG